MRLLDVQRIQHRDDVSHTAWQRIGGRVVRLVASAMTAGVEQNALVGVV